MADGGEGTSKVLNEFYKGNKEKSKAYFIVYI